MEEGEGEGRGREGGSEGERKGGRDGGDTILISTLTISYLGNTSHVSTVKLKL